MRIRKGEVTRISAGATNRLVAIARNARELNSVPSIVTHLGRIFSGVPASRFLCGGAGDSSPCGRRVVSSLGSVGLVPEGIPVLCRFGHGVRNSVSLSVLMVREGEGSTFRHGSTKFKWRMAKGA